MRSHRRALLLGLGLSLALVVALWPRPTYASCDVNIGCYLDEGIVTFLRFLAQIAWFLNGSLLLLSRWIEEQRNWLITDVMASLFASLLKGAGVAWAQAVVIAVVLFVIGFSLRAIAELNWVDARRAIRNGVIALFVFTYGAHLMAASETARVELSMAASQMAEDSLATAGATRMLAAGSSRPGDLMAPVATIYPGATCGGIVPTRTISSTQTVFINDIAANYLFATAEDIHCPSESGASQNTPALPHVFWGGGAYPTDTMGPPLDGAAVQFEGYYSRTPGDALDDTDRQRIVGLAMDGAVRQLFGLFLTIPAVIEQVIQLIFALGLASLWLSLTISLVFALFVPTEGMLSGIGRSAMDLVKASVMTTIGITLVGFVMRTVAASSGVNAGLVAFIGLLCLIILVVMLVNTVRVVFNAAAGMAGITLGAAPAAVLGTLGGMGMVAAMAMKAAPEAVSAGREAGVEAEERARSGGASDQEAKAAGHRAAIAARNAALRDSAVRTFTDIGRATTDAAGFFQDPLRQSMRWQDRADAERRQQEIVAAMEMRDERSASPAAPQLALAAAGAAGGPASASQSSAAARLRGLAPASASNPYTSQTTALGGLPGTSGDASTQAERQAAEEVSAVGKELERAKAELDLVQQQLAVAQGRAAVQKPSALNEREIRRLEKEAEGITGQVARLRQQLDEAERLQRQVSGDAESRRAWGMVQETENQRNAATGTTPQMVLRSSIGLAQQQLDREQQQLDRRPAGDPTVAEDRTWLQQQQAAVGSLRRWNETLARPDASAADRAAGEAAIRKIREDAEREREAARQAGNMQREQIAGGVAGLAGAMLPAVPSGAAAGATTGAPVPAGAAPTATGAPAPAGVVAGAATGTGAPAGAAPTATGAPAPAGAAPTATGAPAPAGAAAEAATGAPVPAGAATGMTTGAPAPAGAPTATGAGAPAGAAAGAATGAPAPAGAATGAPPTASTSSAPAAPSLPTSRAVAAAPAPTTSSAAPASTTGPAAPGMASAPSPQPTLAQRLQAQPAATQAPGGEPAAAPVPASAPTVTPTPAPGGETVIATSAPAPTVAPESAPSGEAVTATSAPAPSPVVAPPSAPAAPATPVTVAPDSRDSGATKNAQFPAGGYISPTPVSPGTASTIPGVAPTPAPAPAVSGTPASSARGAADPHTNTTPGTPSAPGIGSTIQAPPPITSGAQAPAGAGAPSAVDGQNARRRLRVGGVTRREQ